VEPKREPGTRPPGSRQRRLLAAVAALRAEPFAVVVHGKLIQNVPALSWLDAEESTLEAALDASRDRQREMESVAKKLREARERLGDKGDDAVLKRLDEHIRAEGSLAERIGRVRTDVQKKHADVRAQLDVLRDRIDVEALRGRAAALTGDSVPTTPERVSADLEVDFGDLRAQVSRIRDEIAEGERKFAAMNEVSALG